MNVDVVIVTFNRLEKLKKALASYEGQTKTFRNMIVVNNHSTDGTFEYLEEWKKKEAPFSKFVITTEDNLGGSGGYYLGQKKAVELGAEWVFLADDDAYAEQDMMEEFYKYAINHDVKRISAICGTVCHPDGTIDLNHRSRINKKGYRFLNRESSVIEDYEKEEFEIDFLSYVGAFINGDALKKYGLVDDSFFIYWDDSEHSIRLKKFGRIVCVPAIRIVHDDLVITQEPCKAPAVSWKDYYLERNEMVTYKRHFPFVAMHKTRVLFVNRLKRKSQGDSYAEVKWQAVKDAWLGKLGKHKLYKPGWEIK